MPKYIKNVYVPRWKVVIVVDYTYWKNCKHSVEFQIEMVSEYWSLFEEKSDGKQSSDHLVMYSFAANTPEKERFELLMSEDRNMKEYCKISARPIAPEDLVNEAY